MIITDPRFTPAEPPAIAGKPAILVTVHGGYYAEGTPRHDWDHATAWMQRILAAALRADAEHRARELGQRLTAPSASR